MLLRGLKHKVSFKTQGGVLTIRFCNIESAKKHNTKPNQTKPKTDLTSVSNRNTKQTTEKGLRLSSIFRGWVDRDLHRHRTRSHLPTVGWIELAEWEQCRCYREAGKHLEYLFIFSGLTISSHPLRIHFIKD